MTTTTTALALIPAIAAADAALADHYAARPADTAPQSEWRNHSARGDVLARARDAAYRDFRAFICQRCAGRGVTQFRHRLGGVCFQCKGDGLTVVGRRAFT